MAMSCSHLINTGFSVSAGLLHCQKTSVIGLIDFLEMLKSCSLLITPNQKAGCGEEYMCTEFNFNSTRQSATATLKVPLQGVDIFWVVNHSQHRQYSDMIVGVSLVGLYEVEQGFWATGLLSHLGIVPFNQIWVCLVCVCVCVF